MFKAAACQISEHQLTQLCKTLFLTDGRSRNELALTRESPTYELGPDLLVISERGCWLEGNLLHEWFGGWWLWDGPQGSRCGQGWKFASDPPWSMSCFHWEHELFVVYTEARVLASWNRQNHGLIQATLKAQQRPGSRWEASEACSLTRVSHLTASSSFSKAQLSGTSLSNYIIYLWSYTCLLSKPKNHLIGNMKNLFHSWMQKKFMQHPQSIFPTRECSEFCTNLISTRLTIKCNDRYWRIHKICFHHFFFFLSLKGMGAVK